MSQDGLRTPWRLLLLAILIIALSTQPVFLLGAGFVQMSDELGFGATGLGLLTALFFLTASATSTPLGRFVQRVGWRRAMQVNAVTSGVILVLISVAARNTATLAVLLVAAGVVYGAANPAANQALAEHVDPRRRGLMFGLKHAGIPSSTLLAGLAVPLLIVGAGWRVAFAVSALLTIAVLALVPRTTAPGAAVGLEDPRRRVAPLSVSRLVTLSAGSALATWAAVALSTYLVAAAVDVGFSESAAGLLLFAGSAASITSRALAGHLTDRFGGKGFGAMALLTGIGAVVFAFIPDTSGALFAALVLAAFASGWAWPGLMTYAVVNANARTAAASSAVTQSGVFVGAGVGPLVIGAVVDRWSFDAVWVLVAVALAAATVIVAGVGRAATRTAAR